ncbi:BAX-like protein [Mya arenaria]|uniref:BAX-like protein n=1 Tax=Mya arenaria TaxID=6604 RepID=A0ABY7DXE5_MYAAR|nr:apoptosis regulator BAX-like [Mya arenaria]XP_052796490.1 apoptosis regulator BAX-like [Mya arenaria]XP_052796491.1 apoptosis regulator BAX-like [Mya arenaria]XP_052796492.1 apoptosis regulator BAX-like [Mya arenaria]XP_052796717.1 apoptosis regulator BAX-like [Mya arenaria]XP_052796718.1 apoptosis regulator BAX-like [Mya arenaria]XP_052796719.1 apoptosis regulator BAX-like [Mya arenaria]WAR00799.1 BAX-like protein [Mya arenaria]
MTSSLSSTRDQQRARRKLSLRERRESAGDLSNLILENDHNKNPFFRNELGSTASEEETQKEGEVLFGNFIVDQIIKDSEEKISTPEEIREKLTLCTPQGYKNPEWARAGQVLRGLADQFAESRERQQVQQRALEISSGNDIDSVTQEQFGDLLSVLLEGGITQHRIVVLFCFCADIAIAALRHTHLDLCQKFVRWSLEFITKHICSWVQRNGGWGAVFGSSMRLIGKAVVVTGIMAGIGGLCYLGYKRFSHGPSNFITA